MDLGLHGKTAFVAGSSSGLGLAVAEALASEGCNVAICSRSRERIDEAASLLGHHPGETLPLVCDVRDEKQIEDALKATVDRFGNLHILVTNAGGPPSGFIEDFDAKDWREAIELNLMSAVNLCRNAIPYIRTACAKDGLGRIILITSISAKQPIPNLYLSNATRAGVHGFAKSLAEELGPEGITVNAIMPGYTKTDRLMELQQASSEQTGKSLDEVEAGWADQNALKRLADPSEFAASVVFLASTQAAYITGVALPVDGGRSKGLL